MSWTSFMVYLPLAVLLLVGESQALAVTSRQSNQDTAETRGNPLMNGTLNKIFGVKNNDALMLDDLVNISQRWNYWGKPPGSKKVLLAIVGIIKSFGEFYYHLENNFIRPNEEMGWEVYILNLSPMQANCTDGWNKTNLKAHHAEWCHNFKSRFGPQILHRHNMGRRLAGDDHHGTQKVSEDMWDVCHTMPGEVSPGQHATTDYLGGAWRSIGCGGMLHFASRGTQIMDHFKGRNGWDKLVMLRADNSFGVRNFPKHLTKPVLLEQACGYKGGVKVVGPENPEGMFGGEFNQAWILCEGSRAGPFRRALAAMGLPCSSTCTEATRPPCPKGMGLCQAGDRLPCDHHMCLSMSVLNEANTTFGMVDPALGYTTINHVKPDQIYMANGHHRELLFFRREGTMAKLPEGLEPEDDVDNPVIVA